MSDSPKTPPSTPAANRSVVLWLQARLHTSRLAEAGGIMRFWASISLFCLAVAIYQCVAVADRIGQLIWMAFKFGVEPQLISAGDSMVVGFFGATAIFVTLGIFATRTLSRRQSPFRFCSLLSVQMLIAGALVWGGLLASPLVHLVTR